MSFFRKRGASLSLLHGERSRTGVRQLVLHTFRDAHELQRILEPAAWARFCCEVEQRHPGVAPNWTKVRERALALTQNLAAASAAPDSRRKLRRAMTHVTRELRRLRSDDPGCRETAISLGRRVVDMLFSGHALVEHFRGYGGFEGLHRAQQFVPNEERVDDLVDRARQAAARGRLAEAKKLFGQARQEHPFDSDVLNSEGIVHYEREKYSAARELFQAARTMAGLQLEPRRPSYRWSDLRVRPYLRATANLALALEAEGKLEEALVLHRECVELCPQDSVQSRFVIPVLLHKQGRLKEAVEGYRECMGGNLFAVPDPFYNAVAAALALEDMKLAAEFLLQGLSVNHYVPEVIDVSAASAPFAAADSRDYALDYVRLHRALWGRAIRTRLQRLLSLPTIAASLRTLHKAAAKSDAEVHRLRRDLCSAKTLQKVLAELDQTPRHDARRRSLKDR